MAYFLSSLRVWVSFLFLLIVAECKCTRPSTPVENALKCSDTPTYKLLIIWPYSPYKVIL